MYINANEILIKANTIDPSMFDLSTGVIPELTFYNKFVMPGKHVVLTKSDYEDFCLKVDTFAKANNDKILSSDDYELLSKAIDDSMAFQKIVYRNKHGFDIEVYIREKDEVRKSVSEEAETFVRTGAEIQKAISDKLALLSRHTKILCDKVHDLFVRLPSNIVPSVDTTKSVSKAFTDEFGTYKVFSNEMCFPGSVVNKAYETDLEKKRNKTAEATAKICRTYNEAVHEYTRECVELAATSILLKGVDAGTNYELNRNDYLIIFGDEI